MLKLAWRKYMQGYNSALAEIEGCRRCHVAATTVDKSRTVVAPMVQMPCVPFSFFVSRIVARCRDVVGSSTRRTRSGTSINSTPDVWLRTAVARCEIIFVGSHAPHTSYGQRFHRDQICHLRLTCEKFHVCAVCIWLISKKGLDCVDQDAASSASPLRENLSLAMWTAPDFGGSFRLQANICRSCARRRCMMCPPCRQTSSRFTNCYNKSQKNYLDRKDELAVRRIRPSLSSSKAFQAEFFFR